MPIIKVLYIAADLRPGGERHCVLDLAAAIDRDRFLPHVCCLQPDMELVAKLQERGIPFTVLQVGGGVSPVEWWRLGGLIRELGAHLVHTHGGQANLMGCLAAALAGAPVICAHHYRARQPGMLAALVQRRLLRRIDKIFCASKEVRAACASWGMPQEKLEVFHSPVEPAAYRDHGPFDSMKAELGFPVDVPTVGIIDRLEPGSDHELFLRAARRLVDEDPAIHFAIIGDGSLRAELGQRVHELGLTNHLSFAVPGQDPARVYRALDAVVLCGRHEGCSRTILEAQSAGVPVVAMDAGEIAEILARGGGYLLSEATPQAFAVAIDHAIQPENRRDLRLQAMQNVSPFSLTRLITHLEDVYLDLCQEKHAFQHRY